MYCVCYNYMNIKDFVFCLNIIVYFVIVYNWNYMVLNLKILFFDK